MNEVLRDTRGKSDYLRYVFGGKDAYLALGDLVDGNTQGCHHEPGKPCPFESGEKLPSYPSVAEVINNIKSCSINPVGDDAEIVLLYLAERSRHELYSLTGLTIEEYSELADSYFFW